MKTLARNSRSSTRHAAAAESCASHRHTPANGCAWLTIGLFFLVASHHVQSAALAAWSVIFFAGGAYYFSDRTLISSLRFRSSRSLLILSAWALRAAGKVSEMKVPAIAFNAATILGHTSPGDPAEAPVTINELLSVLDHSADNRVTLEIHKYRISAERITPFDRFIAENAGREGATPELTPWIRSIDG